MQYLTFHIDSTIIVPLLKGQSEYFAYPQIYNDSLITIVDNHGKRILFWDPKSNNYIDSFDINVFSYDMQCWGYYVINKDSIILSFLPAKIAEYHDKVLVLVNRNKEILKAFNFVGAPVPLMTRNKDIIQKRYKFSFLNHNKFPVYYDAKLERVLAVLNTFSPYRGDTTLVRAGWVYTDTNKTIEFIDIPECFTNVNESGFFPQNHKEFRGDFDNKGNLYFGVGNHSMIYKYNIKEEKGSLKYVDFTSIDTILTGVNEELGKAWNPSKHEYLDIYFDQVNNRFWRIARIANEINASAFLNNYPVYSIVLLDSNLNKIAEGILPFGLIPNFIPYKNGFLVKDQYQSDLSNSIVLSYVDFSIEKLNVDSFTSIINTRKKQEIKKKYNSCSDYLEDITNHNLKSNVLLIPISSSCETCLIKLRNYLVKEKNNIVAKNLSIIIISDTINNKDNFIGNSYLKKYIGQFIFYDTNKSYAEVMDYWSNPKLLFTQNGAIKKEKIYNFDEMNQLLKDLDKMNNNGSK